MRQGQTEKWCVQLRDLSGPDQVDLYIGIGHHHRPMLLLPGAIIWVQRARRRVSRERWRIYLDCTDDTCITVMASAYVPPPYMNRPSSSSVTVSSWRTLHWGGVQAAPVNTFPRDHDDHRSDTHNADASSSTVAAAPIPVTYLSQLSPWPDAITLSLLRIKCRIVSVYGITLQMKCVICNEILTDQRCRVHSGADTQFIAEARVDIDDGTAIALAYLKSDSLATVMTHAGWYVRRVNLQLCIIVSSCAGIVYRDWSLAEKMVLHMGPVDYFAEKRHFARAVAHTTDSNGEPLLPKDTKVSIR